MTVGIYSLSGFQVSPDTVIAFLTILGYSLYDTIVVFDKVQENTRGLASTNRLTYSDTVNLSMNQVLARSINTSLVAILPILSILVIGAWVLGATALQDFGLALFVGLTTGAYSSIFIASPLLALLKEREPRYAEIRRRLAVTPTARSRRITPAAAAAGDLSGAVAIGGGSAAAPASAAAPRARPRTGRPSAPGTTGERDGSDRIENGAPYRVPPATATGRRRPRVEAGRRHADSARTPGRHRRPAPPGQPAAAPTPQEGPAALSSHARLDRPAAAGLRQPSGAAPSSGPASRATRASTVEVWRAPRAGSRI